MGLLVSEQAELANSPRKPRVNVGDPNIRTFWIGDFVGNPRLRKGRDDKPPCRRPFKGVEDRLDAPGEELPSWGSLGLSICLFRSVLRILLRVLSSDQLLDGDAVAPLVPDEAFQPTKNGQVQRLSQMGGMGDQKHRVMFFDSNKFWNSSSLLLVQPSTIKTARSLKWPR